MIYCFLLAGGTGTRIKKANMPKQFLEIKNVPIIIRTLKVILENFEINKIVICCHKDWIDYTNDLIIEYQLDINRVDITEGGNNRNSSIMAACNYVNQKYGVNNEDVFLAHDSVRPFVSQRILSENIKMTLKYGASTTVYPLIETILHENEEGSLYEAFPREKLYSGQSPQSFNLANFIKNYNRIKDEKKEKFTDAAEIFFTLNQKVKLVIGERENIKITNDLDLLIAEKIIEEINNNL